MPFFTGLRICTRIVSQPPIGAGHIPDIDSATQKLESGSASDVAG